jgi:hypothetical protein
VVIEVEAALDEDEIEDVDMVALSVLPETLIVMLRAWSRPTGALGNGCRDSRLCL